MKKHFVGDWMTSDVITVCPKASLVDVKYLMSSKHIRRLPVVEKGKLVGIVTLGDVREASPSDATSLSVYELNYLLARLTIDRFMTRNVLTVTPYTEIYAAAELMLEHKLGGLPVMANGELVGIITESDIFRILVKEARSEVFADSATRIPATTLARVAA
jgi:acetoin utilization protein AcuB